jgi:flagellar hook protein FlgE
LNVRRYSGSGVLDFDPDGTLKIKYTNDQESSSERLALAWFGDLQSLRQIGDGLFVAPASAESQVAAAQESIMGEIVSGKVEISNIDLTREFTDLIIMQRGFQASSQVLTVSNEMMQELMNNTGRNG